MKTMRKIIIGACCAMLVVGCASDGKAPTLKQTLNVLTSPTTRSVASIARSDNAKEAVKQGLKSRELLLLSHWVPGELAPAWRALILPLAIWF